MTNTPDSLMPPDALIGKIRSRAEEASKGTILVHKELEKNTYPLLEQLAKHVEALWEMAGGGPPWLDEESGRLILALINKLFELVPTKTEELKAEVASVLAIVAELMAPDEEEGA